MDNSGLAAKRLFVEDGSAAKRFLAAVALALIGYGARESLDRLFAGAHTYTAFYPMVILSAYFLGRRPAILTAVCSAALGYWCFARPTFAWKADFSNLASLTFFAITSSVAIYFITGMGRALKDLSAAQARAEGLAQSHAELFRELNERVTNHLQLVAALLQLQARDEADGEVSRALAEASARTLLISKVHRNLAGDAGQTLDFDAFARQLLQGALEARGRPPVSVAVQEAGLKLPLDQATSVAIVLLECLESRLQAGAPGALEVSLRGRGGEAVLSVREADGPAVTPADPPLRRDLIEAMVEQLGGRFTFRAGPLGAVSELVFPRNPTACAAATLH